MTQNELSEAGQNLLNDIQKIIGSKNIPEPTDINILSDKETLLCAEAWQKGYDKANQEWRGKIQKRIDEIEGTSLMSQKDFWHKRTAVDNLEELLSDQPVTDKSLDADGWISVEEKLPDEEIEFLGWDGYYESVMYLSEGCFYYRNDYEAKPTHWRLLPGPPKQQKP